MDNNNSIKSQVDAGLLDKVEQECYQMLYQQRLLYNERCYSSTFFTGVLSFLRWVGLIFSLLGVSLCVFYLVYPGSCPGWLSAGLYLSFFIVTGLFFYLLPRLNAVILARMKTIGGKSCKRMARRYVARARKQVPYVAEYIIKGDLASYFRSKDEQWKQLWSIRLKGFAVMGEHVTLFFRKPTSLHQTTLILYDNNEALELILKEVGIAYKKLSE